MNTHYDHPARLMSLESKLQKLDSLTTALIAERDLLKSQVAELVHALSDLLDRVDRNGGLGEYKGGVPFATKNARELLARLK